MNEFYVAEALFFISVFVFVVTLVIIWPYLFGNELEASQPISLKRRKKRLLIRLRYAVKKLREHFKQARAIKHLVWVS